MGTQALSFYSYARHLAVELSSGFLVGGLAIIRRGGFRLRYFVYFSMSTSRLIPVPFVWSLLRQAQTSIRLNGF